MRPRWGLFWLQRLQGLLLRPSLLLLRGRNRRPGLGRPWLEMLLLLLLLMWWDVDRDEDQRQAQHTQHKTKIKTKTKTTRVRVVSPIT